MNTTPERPVPPAAPLSMPTQDLRAPARSRRTRANWLTWLARLVSFGGCAALSAYALREMHAVIATDGITLLEWTFLGLFGLTFLWIAFPACAAIAGLLYRDVPEPPAILPPNFRVALVMPVYNEAPDETAATLEVMGRALLDHDAAEHFEIFVVSDTTRPEVWLRETAAITELRTRLGGALPLWYRRRRSNAGRKAGNLRDFVERWGARYDAMIVLDADSLMSADTVVRLARAMAADPKLGILQTVPRLAGGKSLFARLQQFAGAVYGPVVARGTAAWQGDDGNYWGHNAIIRTQAFAAASGLPTLPGARPLGGEILSHDFVEAALVRKAGWRVRMWCALEGSWENSPPTLLDLAIRDRRWAQGNVQHLAVLPSRGLAWPNRAHFLIGVMSYVASPLWLALIVVGLVLSGQAALSTHDYFSEASLFPQWPSFDSERMLALLLLSVVVLLVPKTIGLVRVLVMPSLRQGFGGPTRLIGSVLLETLMSALYAPINMLMQTRQLWEIVRGLDAGWSLQQREGARQPWSLLVQRHIGHTLVGVGTTILLWRFLPEILPWLLPVTVGLVLSIPLSRLGGSLRLGGQVRAARWLTIPEERTVPIEFRRRDRQVRRYRQQLDGITLERFLVDSRLQHRHFVASAHRPPMERGRPDTLRLTTEAKVADAHDLQELIGWLRPDELMTLLGDRSLFRAIGRKNRHGEALAVH